MDEKQPELKKCSMCKCNMLLSFYSKNPKTDIYFKCCNQCRAKSIKKCIHNKIKSQCKECKGRNICIHNKQKACCKECKGSNICIHNKIKSQCKGCGGSQLCIHNRQKSQCKECKGGNICIHNRRKSQCKGCGGSQICIHNRQKSQCKECKGSRICIHNRRKSQCKECKGSSICEHDKFKSTCKLCSTVLNCNKCGHETASKSSMKNHIKICVGDEVGSSGEVKIKKVLNEMKIEYEYDSSYEVRSKKSLLRWDFIIKTNEEPLFIEYDGKQHYEAITFWGGEEAFKKTKEYDKLKNDYCNDNGYLLLRIPYTEYEHIEKLVVEFIRDNTNWGYE